MIQIVADEENYPFEIEKSFQLYISYVTTCKLLEKFQNHILQLLKKKIKKIYKK